MNEDELHDVNIVQHLQVDSTEDNESGNDDEDVGDIAPIIVSIVSSSFEAISYLDHSVDFANESRFNCPGNAPLWNEKNPKNPKSGLIHET